MHTDATSVCQNEGNRQAIREDINIQGDRQVNEPF